MGDQGPDVPIDVEESPVARTVLLLAQTLRREFGVAIDAHPGGAGAGAEAGTINRAFRAAVGVVLTGAVPPGEVSGAMTRLLGLAARRRLAEHGLRRAIAEGLLASEPHLGDRWLAYLAIAPSPVVATLVALPDRENP